MSVLYVCLLFLTFVSAVDIYYETLLNSVKSLSGPIRSIKFSHDGLYVGILTNNSLLILEVKGKNLGKNYTSNANKNVMNVNGNGAMTTMGHFAGFAFLQNFEIKKTVSESCNEKDKQFLCNGCDLYECDANQGRRVLRTCAAGTTCINGRCDWGTCQNQAGAVVAGPAVIIYPTVSDSLISGTDPDSSLVFCNVWSFLNSSDIYFPKSSGQYVIGVVTTLKYAAVTLLTSFRIGTAGTVNVNLLVYFVESVSLNIQSTPLINLNSGTSSLGDFYFLNPYFSHASSGLIFVTTSTSIVTDPLVVPFSKNGPLVIIPIDRPQNLFISSSVGSISSVCFDVNNTFVAISNNISVSIYFVNAFLSLKTSSIFIFPNPLVTLGNVPISAISFSSNSRYFLLASVTSGVLVYTISNDGLSFVLTQTVTFVTSSNIPILSFASSAIFNSSYIVIGLSSGDLKYLYYVSSAVTRSMSISAPSGVSLLSTSIRVFLPFQFQQLLSTAPIFTLALKSAPNSFIFRWSHLNPVPSKCLTTLYEPIVGVRLNGLLPTCSSLNSGTIDSSINIVNSNVNLLIPPGVLSPGFEYIFSNVHGQRFLGDNYFVTIPYLSFNFYVPRSNFTVDMINFVTSNSLISNFKIATSTGLVVNKTMTLIDGSAFLNVFEPNFTAIGSVYTRLPNILIKFSQNIDSSNNILRPVILISNAAFSDLSLNISYRSTLEFEDRTVDNIIDSLITSNISFSLCNYAPQSISGNSVICTPQWSKIFGSLYTIRILWGVSSSYLISKGLLPPGSDTPVFMIPTVSFLLNNIISEFLFNSLVPLFFPFTLRKFISSVVSNPFNETRLDGGFTVSMDGTYGIITGSKTTSEPIFVRGMFPLNFPFNIFLTDFSLIQLSCNSSNSKWLTRNYLICNTQTLPFGLSTATVKLASRIGNTPFVSSVSGCTDIGNYTIFCSSELSTQLTITGYGFKQDIITILIGTKKCENLVYISSNRVICELYPSIGSFFAITASNYGDTYESNPYDIFNPVYVSFRPPLITSVVGCDVDIANSPINCKRTGGNLITITGTSFGEPIPSVDSVTVFVGSFLCLNITHISNNLVYCVLDQGRTKFTSIILLNKAGQFAFATPTISYSSCPPGYQDSSIYPYVDCIACDVGKFSVDGTPCLSCNPGRYALSTGSSSCLSCLPGMASYGSTNHSCTLCSPGKYARYSGSDFCDSCEAKQFAVGTGNVACSFCRDNSVSSDTRDSCICNSGFYSNSNFECMKCADIEGAYCAETGRTIWNLESQAGYWRVSSAESLSFLPCPFGSTACPSSRNGSCNEGYTGVLCAVCSPGYQLYQHKCSACSPSSKLLLPVIIVSGVIFVLLSIFIARKFDLKELVISFKIVFSFCQILGSSATVYNIPWPSSLLSILLQLRIALLDFFQLTSFSCWQTTNFYDGYLFTVVGTLILVLFSFILHLICKFILPKFSLKDHKKSFQEMIVKVTTLIISIIYPSVSLTSLSLWNCTPVGSELYLVEDYSLICSGSTYLLYTIFNVIFVTVFVAGWPLFIFFYLFKVRQRLIENTVLVRIGHIFSPYSHEFFYWEVVECLRKLYLTALVVFYVHGSVIQIGMTIFVCVISLVTHISLKPFKLAWVNWLQTFSLAFLWLSFQTALVFVSPGNTSSESLSILGYLVSIFQVLFVALPFIFIIIIGFHLHPSKYDLNLLYLINLKQRVDNEPDFPAELPTGKVKSLSSTVFSSELSTELSVYPESKDLHIHRRHASSTTIEGLSTPNVDLSTYNSKPNSIELPSSDIITTSNPTFIDRSKNFLQNPGV